MNLIQQAVERASQIEREGRVVVPPLAPVPSLATLGSLDSRSFRPVQMRSKRLPLAAIGLALLCILGGAGLYAGLVKTQGDGNVAATTPPVASRVAAAAVPTVAATPAAVAAVAPAVAVAPAAPAVTPAPATPAADPLDEARAAVTGWARAWSDRDVGAYLSFYGTGFVPERGASRAAWEKTRRQMIERRRSISVAINELQLEPLSADRVIANYKQDYAADTYREAGTPKHLVLAREGGAWRIVAEAAGKAGAAAR